MRRRTREATDHRSRGGRGRPDVASLRRRASIGDRPDAPRGPAGHPLPLGDDASESTPVVPDGPARCRTGPSPAPVRCRASSPRGRRAASEDLDAWSSFTTSQPRWRGDDTRTGHRRVRRLLALADDDSRVGALDPSAARARLLHLRRPDGVAGAESPSRRSPAASPPMPVRSTYAAARRRRARSPSRCLAAECPPHHQRPPPYDHPDAGPSIDSLRAPGPGAARSADGHRRRRRLRRRGPAAVRPRAAVHDVPGHRGGRAGVGRVLQRAAPGRPPAGDTARDRGERRHGAGVPTGRARPPFRCCCSSPSSSACCGTRWAAGGERAVGGVATTLSGCATSGCSARSPRSCSGMPDGVGLLLGAVVARRVLRRRGLVGRAHLGRSPLTAVSPNKTWEGLAAGRDPRRARRRWSSSACSPGFIHGTTSTWRSAWAWPSPSPPRSVTWPSR